MREAKESGPVMAMEPGFLMLARVGRRDVRRDVVFVEESWKWKARTAIAASV
jgi:hypothetical protein